MKRKRRPGARIFRYTLRDLADLLGGPPQRRIYQLMRQLGIQRTMRVGAVRYGKRHDLKVVSERDAMRIIVEWYRRRGEALLRKAKRNAQQQESRE